MVGGDWTETGLVRVCTSANKEEFHGREENWTGVWVSEEGTIIRREFQDKVLHGGERREEGWDMASEKKEGWTDRAD